MGHPICNAFSSMPDFLKVLYKVAGGREFLEPKLLLVWLQLLCFNQNNLQLTVKKKFQFDLQSWAHFAFLI